MCECPCFLHVLLINLRMHANRGACTVSMCCGCADQPHCVPFFTYAEGLSEKISDTRESQSPSPPRSASRKRRGPPRTPSCCCRVPARWGERAFAHVSRDTGRPRGGHAEPVISCGCLWERAGAVGVACEGVAGRAPWAVMMRATGGEVPGRLAGMDGALSSPRLAAKPPDAPPTSALPGAPAAMPPPPDGQRPASYCAARGGEPQRGGESLRTMPPPLAPAPSWALAPS
jgi:hypothetical protein